MINECFDVDTPNITHYVFALDVAFTCVLFTVYQSARQLSTSLLYYVANARSQILTHRHIPAIKTSIAARNSQSKDQ
jgi:hypothetical protein